MKDLNPDNEDFYWGDTVGCHLEIADLCVAGPFDFVLKTPPAAVQIIEHTKIKKGSSESNKLKVGSISWDQVRLIAEDKLPDLNCYTVDAAMSMVAGTARSMGVLVKGGVAPKSK